MAAAVLQQLPLAELQPAADNLRRSLGDVDELAASIKSAGLLEPIVAVRENGHFKIVAGHRRYAGAKKAGLKTVDVIVRELSEQARLEAMLIENLQRTDLSPLEEAAAYRRLVDEHGLTQRDLAKRVGRSQPHVSKRLALLELPERVMEQVDAGGITIADAVELTKLKGHPDRIEQVALGGGLRSWETMEDVVERQLREIKSDEQLRAREEQLESNAVATVRVPGAWNLPKGVHRLKGSGHDYHSLQISAKDHEKHGCHAIALYVSGGQVEEFPVCTNRKEHPKIKTLQEKERGNGTRGCSAEISAAAKARLAELESAQTRRHEFVVALLAKRQPLPKAEAIQLIATAILDTIYEDATDLAAVFLGVATKDDLEKARSYDASDKAIRPLLETEAGATRAAIAFAFARYEIELDVNYGGWTNAATYFAVLERAGYEPSPAERKNLPKPKARKEA